nr:hypothetical protein [Amycolatopsis arida]
MALVVVSTVLLVTAGTGAAAQAARVEPNQVSFGLLGPVGLAAVLIGIVGMTAGVLRQRRRAREATPHPHVTAQAPADEPVLTTTRHG